MPNVYKRRIEHVVAEELPAGGTVSGKNGITPVGQGDMQVGGTYYPAAEFAQQFESVPYEECPEDLKAVSDPERYEKEQAHAAQQAEREARHVERRTARAARGNGGRGAEEPEKEPEPVPAPTEGAFSNHPDD